MDFAVDAVTEPIYKAFGSYRHDSDERLAASLQSSLGRFAKPPWYRLRSMRIFRTDTRRSAEVLAEIVYALMFLAAAMAITGSCIFIPAARPALRRN
jgi:hypothetical protein